MDEKKPGNGAPLVGILKNGNSASNGSIKRNGDVPLGQIDTRIEEVDEEEEEEEDVVQEQKEKPQTSLQNDEETKNNLPPKTAEHTSIENKNEKGVEKPTVMEEETNKKSNISTDKGKKIRFNINLTKKTKSFSLFKRSPHPRIC